MTASGKAYEGFGYVEHVQVGGNVVKYTVPIEHMDMTHRENKSSRYQFTGLIFSTASAVIYYLRNFSIVGCLASHPHGFEFRWYSQRRPPFLVFIVGESPTLSDKIVNDVRFEIGGRTSQILQSVIGGDAYEITMSASVDVNFNEQVAKALAESEHLRIDPSRLQDLPEYDLMGGGFGTVRVARLDDDQIVAVKELRITGARTNRAHFSMRFARELKVWAPLDHPNLLKLSGFYIDPAMSTALFVCPFYFHGHIRSYIDANKPDRDLRLKLAKDTALGLRHLHDVHIAHGDLKELNVLVGPEPRALLCDYGLSKIMNLDGTASGLTTSGASMSLRFASPEILNGSRPDLLSDMWAWGCLFLKIVADIGPYEGTLDMACLIKIIQGTPPADVSTLIISSTLCIMLAQCWNLDPPARPNILQCIDIVETIQSKSKAMSPSIAYGALPPISAELYSWDNSAAVSKTILDTFDEWVTSVAFSPDGSLLASACKDAKCRLWDVESNRLVTALDCRGEVEGVAFSPNGKQVAGAVLHSITIWEDVSASATPSSANQASWKEIIDLPTADYPLSVAFSPTGSRLAAGLNGGEIQMWDGNHGEPLFTLKRAKGMIRTLAFSLDGRWLAFSSWERVAWVQDTVATMYERGSPVWPPLVKLQEHTENVFSVAFSPNGSWLASGRGDGAIVIRNVASWTPFTTLHCERSATSLAFSPSSTQVINGTEGGNIQIWDIVSKTSVMILEGHTNVVQSIAVSPDGRRIASGSWDRTIRMWCVAPSTASSGRGEPKHPNDVDVIPDAAQPLTSALATLAA